MKTSELETQTLSFEVQRAKQKCQIKNLGGYKSLYSEIAFNFFCLGLKCKQNF